MLSSGQCFLPYTQLKYQQVKKNGLRSFYGLQPDEESPEHQNEDKVQIQVCQVKNKRSKTKITSKATTFNTKKSIFTTNKNKAKHKKQERKKNMKAHGQKKRKKIIFIKAHKTIH